jgi:hypothetical protein
LKSSFHGSAACGRLSTIHQTFPVEKKKGKNQKKKVGSEIKVDAIAVKRWK